MQCNQHHAFEVVLACVRLYVDIYCCFGTIGYEIIEPAESEYEDGASVCRCFFYLSFCKRKWNSQYVDKSFFFSYKQKFFVRFLRYKLISLSVNTKFLLFSSAIARITLI